MNNGQIQSYWGSPLGGKFTNQQSQKLCIILPGIAYLLDRSYLDYSKQLAVELGYDVLEVEYGFQVNRAAFDVPTQFDTVVDETLQIIDQSIKAEYEQILVIGKSIGTALQIKVNEHLAGRTIRNIAISPINKTVDMGMLEDTLVITSTSDPLLSAESLEKIEAIKGTELMLVDQANHALDIPGDIMKTVEALQAVLQKQKSFIQ